jgi:hypothetical protein
MTLLLAALLSHSSVSEVLNSLLLPYARLDRVGLEQIEKQYRLAAAAYACDEMTLMLTSSLRSISF